MRRALSIEADVAVIGSGAAGHTCAWNLARKGIQAVMMGRGTSATEMSSGCIRFGTLPGVLDDAGWEEACGSVRDLVLDDLGDVGLKMVDGGGNGVRLISAEGSIVREDISQEIIYSGRWEAIEGKRIGVIGPASRKPYDAQLFRKALSGRGIAVEMVPVADEAISSEPFSSLAEAALSSGADMIFIPPFLRLDELVDGMGDLERRTGRRFAEPVMPLCAAGKRLSSALQLVNSRKGIRCLDHTSVDSIVEDGDDLRLMLSSGHSLRELRCRAAVFCGGGIVGGGLGIVERDVVDPLGLMEVQVPSGVEGIMERALASGIRTGRDGSVLIGGRDHGKIFAAGACLPGCNIVMGAGIGSAMASAIIASEKAMEAVR